MVRLIVAAIVIVAAILLFGQGAGQRGGARYIGGISPNSPKGAGGADSLSALPLGYRSDPPNSPYTSRAM